MAVQCWTDAGGARSVARMHNLRRSRNIAFATLVGSIGLGVGLAFERPPDDGALWKDLVIGITACVGLLALPMFLVLSHLRMRARRVERGAGLVAKWEVPASEWQRFLRQELARAGELPENRVTVRPESETGSVRVIVSTTGLLVDDDFHQFAKSKWEDVSEPLWIDGAPPCLQWHFCVEGEYGPSEWTVRVPVAQGAERDAKRVLAHFCTTNVAPPAAPTRPKYPY
jgi:hypothetical protein